MIKHKLTPPNVLLGAKNRTLAAPVPPPEPDFLMTGYTGLPGALEMVAVLAITAAAAWTGIRAGTSGTTKTVRAAGWIGGIGSALFGLLYIGGKTGYGPGFGIPALRVTPS